MEKTLSYGQQLILDECNVMLSEAGSECEADADWEFAAQLIVDFMCAPGIRWRWSDFGGIEFFFDGVA